MKAFELKFMKAFELKDNQRSRIVQLILAELDYVGGNALLDFQAKQKLEPDGIVGINTYNALYKEYLKVTDLYFSGAYHHTAIEKKQIVWHHSAGWDDSRKMFDIWLKDQAKHVATAIGIADDGVVYRGYGEQYWAVHIGAYEIGLPNYFALETQSVGVEICNWGALEERNNQLYTWVGNWGKSLKGVTVPYEKAIELNYKGYKYYEAYTDAEIESLRKWTLLMAVRFDIPLAYSAKDFWEVSAKAQAGTPGLYTHNSYVSWKTDVSPQPKLIAMAKQLGEI